MTQTEAVAILDGFDLRSNADKYDVEALDMGIEAIKKQIPKKPELKAISGFDHAVASQLCCPSCWKSVINYWNRTINPPYCMICGQALDWSDENEP